MKLMDKIKNALFEVEYVEVEEKEPKKITKEKKPVIHEKKEEKPIAKKIVTKEVSKPKRIEKEEPEKVIIQNNSVEENSSNDDITSKNISKSIHKFPFIDDNEFNTNEVVKSKKEIKKEEKRKLREEKVLKENKSNNKIDEPNYNKQVNNNDSKPYGIDNKDIYEPSYGAYEKKEDRGYFHPSPIISPIYGILDKDYKKDEIVNKREVRLTSSYSRENLDVDQVRDKAYGRLIEHDEIERGLHEKVEEDSNFKDNDLLDLSSDEKKPSVKKVTVGDALEYFEDLGLEYNVDYKDDTKEPSVTERVKIVDHSEITDDNMDRYDDVSDAVDSSMKKENLDNSGDNVEEINQAIEETTEDSSSDDDDNLFDLIDSMYDNK